jgi:peroxiredoxin/mono/diheme cytochrome c family protein
MKRIAAVLLAVGVLIAPWGLVANESPSPPISNFALLDINGQRVQLSDFRDKPLVAVIFLGTECPLVNLYMIPLKHLHEEFSGKGVQFLGINSNTQDTPDMVAAHARTHSIPFPILKDFDHKVADLFGARRTPEAFLLNKERRIVYRGRIDDHFGIGYQRAAPTRRDLAEAIRETLAGKPVSVSRTEAVGCLIGREKPTKIEGTVTYTRHIARILQQHCQECHRPGQIGPFSLMTYEKAKAWSDTLVEIVQAGRMPPWHADPRYGKFANDRSMPQEDKDLLAAWVAQGCPKGDDKDMPPPRQFPVGEGWRIGTPDVIISMNESFTVPAQAPPGGVPYQHFIVDTNFDRDMWVQAAEAKPGAKAVVHHIIAYVIGPGERFDPRSEDGLGRGLLVATAPGDIPTIYKPGLAKKVPKGAKIIFQMHYTPNGEETVDRSSIGLIFAKEPPKHIVRTRAPLNRTFVIPAGARNHRVECATVFRKDAMLLNFMPHMHLRGKSFEYRAVYPDGKTEILLSIPRYDFSWQTYYQLAEPKFLPAGTRIECTAHFDNSADNLNNPDPTKPVRWGDQTWEEMMIGWMDYYYLDEKPGDPSADKD